MKNCSKKWKFILVIFGEMWYNIKVIRTPCLSACGAVLLRAVISGQKGAAEDKFKPRYGV